MAAADAYAGRGEWGAHREAFNHVHRGRRARHRREAAADAAGEVGDVGGSPESDSVGQEKA